MVVLQQPDENYWETRKELEASQAIWRSIFERAVRDIVTYRDQRTPYRKKVHETALNWALCWDDSDRDQLFTFPWICDTLGWDPDKAARLIWEARRTNFESLADALKEHDNGV